MRFWTKKNYICLDDVDDDKMLWIMDFQNMPYDYINTMFKAKLKLFSHDDVNHLKKMDKETTRKFDDVDDMMLKTKYKSKMHDDNVVIMFKIQDIESNTST